MSRVKKAVVLILTIAILSVATIRPKSAMALSTAAWVGIGVGSYITFIVTMTLLIFGGKAAPLAEDGSDPLAVKAEPGTVQFGTNCRTTDGNVPIACW